MLLADMSQPDQPYAEHFGPLVKPADTSPSLCTNSHVFGCSRCLCRSSLVRLKALGSQQHGTRCTAQLFALLQLHRYHRLASAEKLWGHAVVCLLHGLQHASEASGVFSHRHPLSRAAALLQPLGGFPPYVQRKSRQYLGSRVCISSAPPRCNRPLSCKLARDLMVHIKYPGARQGIAYIDRTPCDSKQLVDSAEAFQCTV